MVADTFITQLKDIFNDSTIGDSTVENLLDSVIDELNLHGCGLSNMAGSAGSKTITLTSSQKGAVRRIFRCIYASWHKNAANTNTSASGLSLTSTDLMSNSAVINMIDRTARQLMQLTVDPPIYISNAPIDYY